MCAQPIKTIMTWHYLALSSKRVKANKYSGFAQVLFKFFLYLHSFPSSVSLDNVPGYPNRLLSPRFAPQIRTDYTSKFLRTCRVAPAAFVNVKPFPHEESIKHGIIALWSFSPQGEALPRGPASCSPMGPIIISWLVRKTCQEKRVNALSFIIYPISIRPL